MTMHAIPFIIAPAPPCPACGSTVTVQACASIRAELKPGDLVICLGCDAIVVATDTGLRPFTDADWAAYAVDDRAHVTTAEQLLRDVLARRSDA